MEMNEIISGALASMVLFNGGAVFFQAQEAVSSSFSSGAVVENYSGTSVSQSRQRENMANIAEFVDLAFIQIARHQIAQDDPNMPYFHDLWDIYDQGDGI